MTETKYKKIQFALPDRTVEGLNDLVEDGHFINQQDAVRFLLKNGIETYDKNAKSVLKNGVSEPNYNEVSE